jgi:hypothetical protein
MGDSTFIGRDGQTYSSEPTAINPPLPRSTSTKSKTSQDCNVTRPFGPTEKGTNQNGYFPGGK